MTGRLWHTVNESRNSQRKLDESIKSWTDEPETLDGLHALTHDREHITDPFGEHS
jgi:hypothetical protein